MSNKEIDFDAIQAFLEQNYLPNTTDGASQLVATLSNQTIEMIMAALKKYHQNLED